MAVSFLGTRSEGGIQVNEFDVDGRVIPFAEGDPIGDQLKAQHQPLDPMATAQVSPEIQAPAPGAAIPFDPAVMKPASPADVARLDAGRQVPGMGPVAAPTPQERAGAPDFLDQGLRRGGAPAPKPPPNVDPSEVVIPTRAGAPPQQQEEEQPDLKLFSDGGPRLRRTAATPGGFVDGTRKFRGAPEAAQGFQNAQMAITEQRGNVIAQSAMAQAEAARAQEKKAREDAMHAELRRSVLESEAREKQRFVEQRTADFQRQRAAIAQRPVNTNDVLGSKRNAMMIAALGLAQYGNTLAGVSGNPVMQMINNSIERETDEKMRLMQADSDSLDDEEKEFWRSMQAAGETPEQMREKVRLLEQDRKTAELHALAANGKLGEISINAQRALVENQQDALDRLQKIHTDHAAEYSQKYRPGTAGGVSIDWKEYKQRQEADARNVELGRKLGIIKDPEKQEETFTYFGPDGKPAGEAPVSMRKEVVSQTHATMNYLDSLQVLKRELTRSKLDPQSYRRARAAAMEARMQYKEKSGAGALDQGLIEQMDKAIPEDMDSIVSITNASELVDMQISSAIQQARSLNKALGNDPNAVNLSPVQVER